MSSHFRIGNVPFYSRIFGTVTRRSRDVTRADDGDEMEKVRFRRRHIVKISF